jgi:hypothetical protein
MVNFLSKHYKSCLIAYKILEYWKHEPKKCKSGYTKLDKQDRNMKKTCKQHVTNLYGM